MEMVEIDMLEKKISFFFFRTCPYMSWPFIGYQLWMLNHGIDMTTQVHITDLFSDTHTQTYTKQHPATTILVCSVYTVGFHKPLTCLSLLLAACQKVRIVTFSRSSSPATNNHLCHLSAHCLCPLQPLDTLAIHTVQLKLWELIQTGIMSGEQAVSVLSSSFSHKYTFNSMDVWIWCSFTVESFIG